MLRPAAASLLLLAGLALADDLYPKTGRSAFATGVMVVEEKDGKVYYLDKQLKTRSWPKDMLGRIERKPCDVYEYVAREKKIQTADDAVALAEWAGKKRFHKTVIQALYERALELDPNHEQANTVLGRVQYEGEWMTPEQRDQRVKEAEDAAMRAKGLVRWQDQWVTPEDKAKLDSGLRLHEGKWMTEDEIKEAQGFVKHEGKWVKKDELEVLRLIGPARTDTQLGDALLLHQTENYAILGDLPPDQLQQLGETMERLFAEWQRIFPDSKDSDILAGKHRLFAFRKNPPYQRLARARYQRQKQSEEWSKERAVIEEERMKLRLRETSFWEVTPEIFSAHVQMPDPFEGLKSHCVHFGSNILMTRYARIRFPTWWLNEGLAYYFEKKLTGAIQTFNADAGGGVGYADAGPTDQNNKNPWLDETKWPTLLLQLIRGNRDPRLDQMKSKVLWGDKKRLGPEDLAKAASVVTFLIEDDTKKFAAFVRDAKEGSGAEVDREVAAVLAHYGSYEDLEKRWRQYALNGFKIVR